MKITWRKGKPDQPGWWWIREDGWSKRIARVWENKDGLLVIEARYSLRSEKCCAGPIPEPEEPKLTSRHHDGAGES